MSEQTTKKSDRLREVIVVRTEDNEVVATVDFSKKQWSIIEKTGYEMVFKYSYDPVTKFIELDERRVALVRKD